MSSRVRLERTEGDASAFAEVIQLDAVAGFSKGLP